MCIRDSNNFNAIEDFCINESIKLVIIGPEQPLVEGLTNYLHSKNINTFGMYLDNYWYELITNQENINSIDPVESLDVSILHDLIIEPLLGITDERTDPKIDFVGGARGLKELENRVDKDGFDIAVRIMPYLIAILVAIGMFRASGAMELFISSISPILNAIGFPPENVPLAIMRPLSGSGSLALFTDLVNEYGADSLFTKIGATMFGSTETTFYVLAVYFGSVGIRKSRHALAAGLIADAVGVIAAVYICKIIFI